MPKSNPAKSQSKAGTAPSKGKAAASDSAAGSIKPKAAAAAPQAPVATPKAPAAAKAAPKKVPLKEAAEASKKKPEAGVKKTVSDATKPKKQPQQPSKVAPEQPTPVPRPPVVKTKLTDLTDPFLILQRDRIFQLRDSILESMQGVAKDTLRSRAEGSEASAFGMHQADAGSDAYDRDFALSLLSQEQDALYEIEEALKRMELGSYGVCEMSGKKISHARLEALPFARYTVECQAEVERQKKLQKARMPVTSLFGLTDEEGGEGEDEDQIIDTKE
jgi:DnaK suppressor protein